MPAPIWPRFKPASIRLGLPSCRLVASEVKKQGFRATQITVEHEPEHKHRHLHHITAMIDGSTLTARQKELATRIFRKLAEAEAKVHGSTIEKVHFHEVGAVDSIADIVGAAIGFDLLGVERIVCSPVPTGHGYRRNRPRPLLDSGPGDRRAAPRRAACAARCRRRADHADRRGDRRRAGRRVRPAARDDRRAHRLRRRPERFSASRTSCACSSARSLQRPCQPATDSTKHRPHTESIVVLETNLDNATGETIGHAVELLWAAGALDVSLTPIQMKKGRPGVLVSVQARPADADKLEAILFRRNANARRAAYYRTAYCACARGANRRNALGTRGGQSRVSARWLPAVHARIRIVPCHRRSARPHRWPK